MSSNIELTIIQIIIMIVLFCIIILLLRQRKAIEYERRIARYSISPLEYKDKSFADIVYDKYYRPESERAIYDVKTGKLVLKHGYNHEVESDNYVFFDAERNYNEPKKVLMLNKETGEVKEWL